MEAAIKIQFRKTKKKTLFRKANFNPYRHTLHMNIKITIKNSKSIMKNSTEATREP